MLDLAAAERFVRNRYGSSAGRVCSLGAGEWSRAYAFALDGEPMAIRFGGHLADFIKDRRMAAHSRVTLRIPARHGTG